MFEVEFKFRIKDKEKINNELKNLVVNFLNYINVTIYMLKMV